MEESEAMLVVQELGSRTDLTGDEKQMLREAREVLGEDLSPVSETETVSLDPAVIRTLDPFSLTGAQKAALGGGTGGGRVATSKPRPRAALTPDGRDPRTLTGPEKRALGFQHKQRAARELPAPPVVVSGALTNDERHELGMLRAGQGSAPLPETMEAIAREASPAVAAAVDRLELALRREYRP